MIAKFGFAIVDGKNIREIIVALFIFIIANDIARLSPTDYCYCCCNTFLIIIITITRYWPANTTSSSDLTSSCSL